MRCGARRGWARWSAPKRAPPWPCFPTCRCAGTTMRPSLRTRCAWRWPSTSRCTTACTRTRAPDRRNGGIAGRFRENTMIANPGRRAGLDPRSHGRPFPRYRRVGYCDRRRHPRSARPRRPPCAGGRDPRWRRYPRDPYSSGFPGRATGAHGLVAQHPDAFVAELHPADPRGRARGRSPSSAARRRPPRSASDDLAGCAIRVAAPSTCCTPARRRRSRNRRQPA